MRLFATKVFEATYVGEVDVTHPIGTTFEVLMFIDGEIIIDIPYEKEHVRQTLDFNDGWVIESARDTRKRREK